MENGEVEEADCSCVSPESVHAGVEWHSIGCLFSRAMLEHSIDHQLLYLLHLHCMVSPGTQKERGPGLDSSMHSGTEVLCECHALEYGDTMFE